MVKLDHDGHPSALTPLFDKLRERIERAYSRWKLVYCGDMTFSSLHLPYCLFFPFPATHCPSPWIRPCE